MTFVVSHAKRSDNVHVCQAQLPSEARILYARGVNSHSKIANNGWKILGSTFDCFGCRRRSRGRRLWRLWGSRQWLWSLWARLSRLSQCNCRSSTVQNPLWLRQWLRLLRAWAWRRAAWIRPQQSRLLREYNTHLHSRSSHLIHNITRYSHSNGLFLHNVKESGIFFFF